MIRLVPRLSLVSLLVLFAHGAAADDNQVLEGGESVSREAVYAASQPALTDYKPFQGYFDWKAGLRESKGLTYGFNAYLLPQWGTTAPTGTDDAFSGVYRFLSSWTVAGRGTERPGKIELRIEHRTAHGSSVSPTDYAGELGIAALNPGFIYSDNFDTDFSVLNWTQIFRDKRFGFAVGRLAFDVYQDAYFLQTISGNLLNRSFVVNPAIGTTGIGALGAVLKGFVSDNVWLGGQIYDANAQNGEFDLDTVQEGEWLTNVEIGWTPDIEAFRNDRVVFTYWHKDEREAAGVSSGNGWALSASRTIGEQFIPFLRLGYSDGGAGVAAKRSASIGFRYSPRKSQALAVGLGWAEPSDKSLRDEYVLEAGYKVQLTPQVSILPDVQYIRDPANNPDDDELWIFSLRTIFAF